MTMNDQPMAAASPHRPYFYTDAGVKAHLEILRGLALGEDTELTHVESGVTLVIEAPESRLSVIAAVLDRLIKHFDERELSGEAL